MTDELVGDKKQQLPPHLEAQLAAAKKRLITRADLGARPASNTRPVRTAASKTATRTGLVMARLAQKTRFADPALVRAWTDIVGEELAALGRPGRLSGGRKDRTFEICAPNGAAATALSLATGELIERLNTYYGPGTIGRIKVRQIGRPSGQGLSRFRDA